MLLKNSFSNTKKFFKKTLQNFKSFFSSSGYQRLPKTPTHHHYFPYSSPMDTHQSHHHPELQTFNNNNNNADQWDSQIEKAERRRSKEEEYHENHVQKKKKMMMEKRDDERNTIRHRKGRREGSPARSCVVERKLRELEMLDMGNVEYILDIEEVLHYYSRLTCPAYVEIVDDFFMQMYSEFFAPLSKLSLPHH